MSNDIKVSKNVGIQYIPKDRRLCVNCMYYEVCPCGYTCNAHDDLVAFQEEYEEL